MATFDLIEAQTHLADLIAQVEAGEEVVITRNGEPLARLVPISAELPAPKPRRVFGQLRGKGWMAPDFDAPDPQLEALFYGEDEEENERSRREDRLAIRS